MTSKERLSKIFLPYIIVTAISLISFGIIYYRYVVAQEPDIDRGFANLGLPALYLIPFQIVILVWFAKNFRTPKKRLLSFFFLIYSFSIFPVITVLPIIRKMSMPIVSVKNVYSIEDTNVHFYKILDFYIDTTKIGETYTFTAESRRHGKEYYAMNVGFAAPIKQKNANGSKYTYWCYEQYNKNTDSRNVAPDFLEVYKQQCRVDYIRYTKTENIKYFEKIPERWINGTTLEAINDSSNRSNKPIIVLVPHNETIGEENLKQTFYFIAALLAQIGFWLLVTFKSLPKTPQKT